MSSAAKNSGAKKKSISPILFGVIAFFLIFAAILFNQAREVILKQVFAPQWYKDFGKAAELAKKDEGAGVKAMEQCIATSEKITGDDMYKTPAYRSMGQWHMAQKKYAEARADFLKGTTAGLKSNQPLDAAATLSDTAILDHYNGVVSDGEALAEQSIELKQKNHGTNDEFLGWAYTALALAAMDAGHYQKAEDAWHKSIEINKRMNTYGGLPYIDGVNFLACTYALESKRSLADKTFIENIAEADKRWQVGNECTDPLVIEYAHALRKSGDEKSAQVLLTRIEDEDAFQSKTPRTLQL